MRRSEAVGSYAKHWAYRLSGCLVYLIPLQPDWTGRVLKRNVECTPTITVHLEEAEQSYGELKQRNVVVRAGMKWTLALDGRSHV